MKGTVSTLNSARFFECTGAETPPANAGNASAIVRKAAASLTIRRSVGAHRSWVKARGGLDPLDDQHVVPTQAPPQGSRPSTQVSYADFGLSRNSECPGPGGQSFTGARVRAAPGAAAREV